MTDARLSDAFRVLQLQQELIEWQALEIVRLRLERDDALRVKYALANMQKDIDMIKERVVFV